MYWRHKAGISTLVFATTERGSLSAIGDEIVGRQRCQRPLAQEVRGRSDTNWLAEQSGLVSMLQ